MSDGASADDRRVRDGQRLSPHQPERPRIRPIRLVVAWFVSAAALLFAAWIVPGVAIEGRGGAFVAAAVIAVLNAYLLWQTFTA